VPPVTVGELESKISLAAARRHMPGGPYYGDLQRLWFNVSTVGRGEIRDAGQRRVDPRIKRGTRVKMAP
jgi:hypothetical protein